MKRSVLFALAIASTASSGVAQPNWSVPVQGSYNVGYRRVDSAGLVVHIWYPAAIPGRPMKFREYVAPRVDVLTSFFRSAGISDSTVARLLETTMRATDHATPRRETFPVVLIAQGNEQDAADQATLSEFIASHGFVVITTPSPTLRTPLEREDQIGAIAELQGTELREAMDRVPADISFDKTRIGIVGHSFGARAALLLAMRDSSIHALVSLDGGIGTATGVEAMRAAPSFRGNVQLPPLLHLYERLDAFMTPDFGLIRSLQFRSVDTVETRGMRHTHFTTYGAAAGALPEIGAATRADSMTGGSVVAMYQTVLAFLRAQAQPAR
jgi:dienelactone hydrolase